MPLTLIGVDCATRAAKVGLARGVHDGGRTIIKEVCLGSSPLAEVVAGWVRASDRPVLLALDAPLGWPAPLAAALPRHRAGAPLADEAHALFRRATDRFVKTHLGKQPLDVGADRIARTAHAALRLLQALRDRLGEPIPLAWGSAVPPLSALEVYPAATLRAHGIDARGYKRPDGTPARRRVLDALAQRVTLQAPVADVAANDDLVDAALCVLAAHDFVTGQVLPPPDLALAQQEGWIWVRPPGA